MNVMKLSFKNLRSNIRKNPIHFVSLIFSVGFFYAFLSIVEQKDFFMNFGVDIDVENVLSGMVGVVSGLIGIAVVFLAAHSNRFLLTKKKQEIGLLQILGMKNKRIGHILWIEMLFVTLLSLTLGLVLGMVLSNLSLLYTMNIYQVAYSHYSLFFSIAALLRMLALFLLVNIVLLFCNFVSLKKSSALQLFQAEVKGEGSKKAWKQCCGIMMIIAAVALGLGAYLLVSSTFFELSLRICCGLILLVVGAYILTKFIAPCITEAAQANRQFYLKKINLFTVNQLSSHLNSFSRLLFTSVLTLTIALSFFCVGLNFSTVYNEKAEGNLPYDASFLKMNEENEESQSYLTKEITSAKDFKRQVAEYYEAPLYQTGINFSKVMTHYDKQRLSEEYKSHMADVDIPLITISDYNRFMQMQGKRPMVLSENEYAVLTSIDRYYDANAINEMQINGKTYTLGGRIVQGYLYNYSESGFLGVLVVPDQAAKGLKAESVLINMAGTPQMSNLETVMPDDIAVIRAVKSSAVTYYMETRMEMFNISISVAIAFIIVAATLLAMQQSSAIEESLPRYRLLWNIGACQKMILSAALSHQLLYFFVPLVLSLVCSVPVIIAYSSNVMARGIPHTAQTAAIGLCAGVGVYILYFLITYWHNRRSIMNALQKNKPVTTNSEEKLCISF